MPSGVIAPLLAAVAVAQEEPVVVLHHPLKARRQVQRSQAPAPDLVVVVVEGLGQQLHTGELQRGAKALGADELQTFNKRIQYQNTSDKLKKDQLKSNHTNVNRFGY